MGGFPGIRWSQTASYGYVPNSALGKVFMAVAMDLGDPSSPHGSVHPRDKQDVGMRLSLSARNIVYGQDQVYYSGPLAFSAWMVPATTSVIQQVQVEFRNVMDKLELRWMYGFEIGCVDRTQTDQLQWLEGTIKSVSSSGNSVTVEFPKCPIGFNSKMIRYAWRTDPCSFKKCAIYSGSLPSPPFVMDVQLRGM